MRGLVVPAAGIALRLDRVDKTVVPLAGRPSLHWILDAFAETGLIDEVAIAVSQRNRDTVVNLVRGYGDRFAVRVVEGGASRGESVARAVATLSDRVSLVVIHDAARPLVTSKIISAVVETGEQHGAAIAAVPVTDTVKRVTDRVVQETVDRSMLMAAQTPQAFRREWLAHAYALSDVGLEATDEASLLERAGYAVQVVAGSSENLKLTTPTDLELASLLLARRGGGSCCG
jgi:2-C-methyl-D-erythritol 4-phosphate cytidylyltransferase